MRGLFLRQDWSWTALASVVLAAVGAPLLSGTVAHAAVDVSEAEYASLTPGAGQVFDDATASGGRGLLVWSNGTAETTLISSASERIVVRARGDQCQGAPTMTVTVDGAAAGTALVTSTTWADYAISGSWAAGTHRVSMAFTNDYVDGSCDRNLRLDRVGMTAAPEVVEQEAETAALTPGAGQVFTDATASAGQGLLIWSNGAAAGWLSAPAGGTLEVRAEGDQCNGAPHMQVAVDGTTVMTVAVPNTKWATFPVPGSWAGGTRRVSVAFTDDYRDSSCDRNLRVDLWRVAPAPQARLATQTGNPFAGATGYVDPNSNPRRAADARRSTDPAGAAALDKVAAGSAADWYGDWVPAATLAATVANRIKTETATGALPVLVAYAIPHRDCGSYSAGGEPTADAYRQWIGELAAGIGNHKSVVVLEPDALPQMDCLSSADQIERVNLLAAAVRTLSANPTTSVYLDAGGPGWQTASVMAGRLSQADIADARGFSLNVSGYNSGALVASYGDTVSALVGGKHFIVDTSRNGLGAGTSWCNPSGRALGIPMTVITNDPLADAFTWVKAPGESDGACNGGPSAGTFWTDYAIGLANRSTVSYLRYRPQPRSGKRPGPGPRHHLVSRPGRHR